MAETKIARATDVWNPVTGCDQVSEGCGLPRGTHGTCYAMTLAKRLKAMGNPRYQVDGDARKPRPVRILAGVPRRGLQRVAPGRSQPQIRPPGGGRGPGALAVVMPPSEPLTPAGSKLIQDLAAQAGLVLRNVRLIEELRASRQRIVTAQDARAKTLERNIHDGAQQQLVALKVKLGLAQRMVERDPVRAQSLLSDLQVEAGDALEGLRDLARGIYPPLLADKGLFEALSAQARKSTLPVEVQGDGVARYSQEAEAAIYFCCLEALQNAAKYSEATRVLVRLSSEVDAVEFTVQDDGAGFDPARIRRGAGLQNMADRLEALGGSLEVSSRPGAGTSVTGRIPTLQVLHDEKPLRRPSVGLGGNEREDVISWRESP